MMNNKHILAFSIAQLLASLQLNADHVITFFIRPYPQAQRHESFNFMQKIHKPGKLAKYYLKKLRQDAPTAGIFCTYAGFLTASNLIGQVTFPRKHEAPELTIIVAKKISPMIMAGNTIHHWEIAPDTPARSYHLEQKQDPETELWYWDVTPSEIPENGIIRVQSILIFAKPKNIFIPEGISLTTDGPNLVLPAVYTKKGIQPNITALFVAGIRQFFSSGQPDIKREGTTYQMQEVY